MDKVNKNRYSVLVPLYDFLDCVGRMMAYSRCKLRVRVTIGDQSGDVIAPTQVRLKQIIGSHLEVAPGSIHAAEHDLIVQDQLADQFRSLNL